MNRFIALDVETSNSDRSSICQIGWVVFENGRIISEYSSLINPNSAFLSRNIQVHGIQPQNVVNAPAFADVHPLLLDVCEGAVVAHHGDFDWQSIGHAAYLEGLDFPDCEWLNTRKASQEAWAHLPNHKLDTLCRELGIELAHHDALEDARACGRIVNLLHQRGLLNPGLARRVKEDDVAHYTHRYPKNGVQVIGTTHGKKLMLAVEKGLGELAGFLEGVLADNVVDSMELTELDEWVRANHDWMSMSPWDELISLIDEIDGAPESEYFELLQDLMWLANRLGQEYFQGQALEISQLEGVFHGVLADGVLLDEEVHAMEAWLQNHAHLQGHFLYDGISKLIQDVLEDGVITEDERRSLIQFMLDFTSNISDKAKEQLAPEPAAEASHSVYSTPLVQFQEHVFCLSGDFDCFESKSEVEDLIQSLGGTASKSVTKKVHYLVVGGAGSADWKFGKYGRKIEKALDYRAKGVAIEVIEETWLVSHF